jgi:lysophospholipase L1-like esterase
VSIDGNASPAIYEQPSVTGGKPPINTTCTPASGSIFVLGTSTVTCTATDAILRVSSCAFKVTVTVPPRISAPSFVAFGNSITEGKDGNDPGGHSLANTYPVLLRALLAARYTAQTITVANRGCGGERAVAGLDNCGQGGGVVRLPGVLNADRPQVLLLEEGINDLGDDPRAIGPMVDALADMIQEARARGIQVFVATLLPERPGAPKAAAVSLITPANERIRQMAAYEGARLVDLYEGFGGSPDPYIGADGLHPNQLGYQKIAELFFDAIRATLEVSSTPASALELVRNMPGHNTPFARLH